MRWTLLAAILAALAAMPAAGRERTAAHPSDETEVDARRGPLVLGLNARPGLGIQLANRPGLRPVLDRLAAARLPVAPTDRVRLARDLAAGGALSSTAPAGS